jgi:tetratricopeptide (TPR) repeat protein
MKLLNFIIIILTGTALLLCPLSSFSQESSIFMREGDALWKMRSEEENARSSISFYKRVLATDPESYEAHWKIARANFYLGDQTPETKKMRDKHKELGKEGMYYARKALELNPKGIEGHYYYALCIAQYSIGVSILRALAKGLGPEYEKHTARAIEINKQYDYAGPLRAMGRYWYQLPWPKRDLEKSISYLEEAQYCAPKSIRGKVYLAEAYFKNGQKEKAREQLKKTLGTVPAYDVEIDAGRWKDRARALLKEKF